MYQSEGITVLLAGLPIHVDCEPENAEYCLHLTSQIEPRAQTILEAAPNISLTELLFLLALSLADEIYGPGDRAQSTQVREDTESDDKVELISSEQRALNMMFRRIRG
jgi:cell division protein ZapA (FtsZ GTPase activity inhibitor)